MSDSLSTTQNTPGDYNALNTGSGSASVTINQYPPPPPINIPTLDEALKQFASLPLEHVPDVSPLPMGSYMPFRANPLFVGREPDLRLLASLLKGNEIGVNGPVAVTATTGLAGVGKTQLASEFVHRYGQYFIGGVFWLNCADINAVPTEIVKCCNTVDLAMHLNYNALSLEDQVRLVIAAWESPFPRLLVFDNCEDEEVLHRWSPRTGGCHVLITSRRAVWSPELGIETLPLKVLNLKESVDLLRKYRPDLVIDELEAIANELAVVC